MLKAWGAVMALCSAANAHSAGEHEHGVGYLDLATEGNKLQLSLTLAAEDLASSGVNGGVDKQGQWLQANLPLTFKAGSGCNLIAADIEHADEHLELQRHDDHNDHHDEHGHGTEAHHDEHNNDEHRGESQHADIKVQYLWQCAKPVLSAKVALFEQLSALEIIKAQVITPKQQKSQQLIAANAELHWH